MPLRIPEPSLGNDSGSLVKNHGREDIKQSSYLHCQCTPEKGHRIEQLVWKLTGDWHAQIHFPDCGETFKKWITSSKGRTQSSGRQEKWTWFLWTTLITQHCPVSQTAVCLQETVTTAVLVHCWCSLIEQGAREGHWTLAWHSSHPSQLLVYNSALITCGFGSWEGLEYTGWKRQNRRGPHLHHHGEAIIHARCRPCNVATLGSPTLLPITPHSCSISKPNKLTDFPGESLVCHWVFMRQGKQILLGPHWR